MLGSIICKDKPQFATYLLMDIWGVPSFGLLQVKLFIIPYLPFKSCTVSLSARFCPRTPKLNCLPLFFFSINDTIFHCGTLHNFLLAEYLCP